MTMLLLVGLMQIFSVILCIVLVVAALIVLIWLSRGLWALLSRRKTMSYQLKMCTVCGKADCSEEKHTENNPTTIALKFKNPADARFFMSQLSDGWGENYVSLKWDTAKSFDTATEFEVEPFPRSTWFDSRLT
jgi:hypothetical protein